MPYKGHVENGVVVVDEPVPLKEGVEVRIEIVAAPLSAANLTPLRGTPYHFDDPFSPATTESDWEAAK